MQYTDLIVYFKDRFTELFHKDSLDSYRVRYHNTLSVIKELRKLIEGWQNKNIKRAETLLFCIADVNEIIGHDDVFDFSICSKKRFGVILKEFSDELRGVTSDKDRRPSMKGTHLVYLLNKYISLNQPKYLDLLWDEVERIIFMPGDFTDDKIVPNIDALDRAITSLAREILNSGYSKSTVFFRAKKYGGKDNSIESFRQFRQQLSASSLSQYTVLMQLYISDASKYSFTDFKEEVPTELNDVIMRNNPKYVKFVSKAQNRRFYITQSKDVDAQSAIRKAKVRLFGELDAIHVGISQMNVITDQRAIVVEHCSDGGEYVTMYPTQFVLDGAFPQNIAISNKFSALLKEIKSNPTIDDSVKIRLDGALRHLRIANSDSEIEQRYINYWIALEFIFSSPLIEENTYLRLKVNLTNILSACYVARNLRSIESILVTKGLLKSGELLTKENIDSIIKVTQDLLIKYRLMKFKSCLFTETERKKKYLHNHINNLEAHLSRMYHLRNELIHEAGINQDIEDLTSNLKYYLTFLLNQMIVYFSSLPNEETSASKKIDEFFYEYQIIMDNIREDWSLDKMRNVPYHNELLSN